MKKANATNSAAMKKTLICAVAASAVAMVVPFATQASGSNSTNFTATLTLVNSCTITAANMTFSPADANQNNLSEAITASSNLSVLCTNTTPYSVSLGSGATGTIAARLLTSGGTNVSYNLYTDNTYGTVWGDGTTGKTVGLSGSTVVQSTGTSLGGVGIGTPQTLTVYGKVPVQTAPAPATYTDTIAATVNF